MVYRTLLLLILASAAHASSLVVGLEQPVSTPPHGRAIGTQRFAALGSSGDQALAVWTDTRSGSEELYGARIDADGNVLDRDGFLLDTTATELPSVAWNGRDYVVTAQTWSATPETYTWLVGPDGRVSERQKLGHFYNRSLASSGSEVVLGASDSKNGVFVRLASDGSVAGTQAMGDFVSTVAPVADGGEWFAFYNTLPCQENGGPCDTELRFRDIASSKDLAVMSNGLFTVQLTAAGDGNGHFLATWGIHEDTGPRRSSYKRYVLYTVVDRTGKVLVPPTRIEGSEVIKQRGIPISDLRNGERPAVVWDGKQFVISWSWWNGSGETELRATRIAADGTLLDILPVSLDRRKEPQLDPYREPALAVTRSRLLVAWSQNQTPPAYPRSDLVYRAVRSFEELKEPVAPAPLATAPPWQGGAKLASGDGGFAAVWVENDGMARVVGRVFADSGAAGDVFTLRSAERMSTSPAVAYAAGVYLFAWREEELGPVHDNIYTQVASRVFVRRYDTSGRPLDPAPIELPNEPYLADARNSEWRATSVASDGQQFLVVWNGVDDLRMHAARVTAGGTLLDAKPFPISPASYARRGFSAAVWTGKEFFVAWYENPVSYLSNARPLPHLIRGTRVSPNGTVLDSSFPVLVETAPRIQSVHQPFGLAVHGNELLATWSYDETASQERCVHARRFDLTGKPLDAQPVKLRCPPAGTLSESKPLWYRNAWHVLDWNRNGGSATLSALAAPEAPLTLPVDGALTDVLPMTSGMLTIYGRQNDQGLHRLYLRRAGETRARSVRH